MSIQLKAVLTALLLGVGLAASAAVLTFSVVSQARLAGLADVAGDALILEAVEAATNVIWHVTPALVDASVVVRVADTPASVEVSFYYIAEPYVPLAREPVFSGESEGGFGLCIIENSVDAVTYDSPAAALARKLVQAQVCAACRCARQLARQMASCIQAWPGDGFLQHVKRLFLRASSVTRRVGLQVHHLFAFAHRHEDQLFYKSLRCGHATVALADMHHARARLGKGHHRQADPIIHQQHGGRLNGGQGARAQQMRLAGTGGYQNASPRSAGMRFGRVVIVMEHLAEMLKDGLSHDVVLFFSHKHNVCRLLG